MNDKVKMVIIGRMFLDCKKYMSPQVPTVWEQLVSYWYFKKDTQERVNDWVSPGLGSIAHDTGLSKNTIRKCFRELSILGFITKIESRYNKINEKNETNKYYLDDNPKNVLDKLPELEKFRNVKRSKNVIAEDGWGTIQEIEDGEDLYSLEIEEDENDIDENDVENNDLDMGSFGKNGKEKTLESANNIVEENEEDDAEDNIWA